MDNKFPKKKIPKKILKNKEKWVFQLYIAGGSPIGMYTYNTLKSICNKHFKNYKIQIIDLLQHPNLAKKQEIIAIPTIIRISPKPNIKIIGDLSNPKQALLSLKLDSRMVDNWDRHGEKK